MQKIKKNSDLNICVYIPRLPNGFKDSIEKHIDANVYGSILRVLNFLKESIPKSGKGGALG